MFDQGDFAENDVEAGIEVFRAAEPPANVWDFIVILKAYTNSILDMKEPATLKDAWRNITEAIAHSEQVESMVWKKLPEAKFGFKIRNIFKMEKWMHKTTFQLKATDSRLGITKAQLESECQAIGYDLSKIPGYDPNCILNAKGWAIIKHYLMALMHANEFKKLSNKLQDAGLTMNKTRMKMLKQAAEGWQV